MRNPKIHTLFRRGVLLLRRLLEEVGKQRPDHTGGHFLVNKAKEVHEVGILDESLDEGRVLCQTVADGYETLCVKIEQRPAPDEPRIHPEEDLLEVRGILLETACDLLDKGDGPMWGRRLDDDGEVIPLLKGFEALGQCDEGMTGRNEAQPADLKSSFRAVHTTEARARAKTPPRTRNRRDKAQAVQAESRRALCVIDSPYLPPASVTAEGAQLNVPPFPASVTAEGAQLNVPPFPASVTAEGAQLNVPPSACARYSPIA